MATTGNTKAARDAGAVLAYLDARRDAGGSRVGVVGLCMGGGMAIAAAGTNPERSAAVASVQGGNLATDAPHSPHAYAPHLEVRLCIASATARLADDLDESLQEIEGKRSRHRGASDGAVERGMGIAPPRAGKIGSGAKQAFPDVRSGRLLASGRATVPSGQ